MDLNMMSVMTVLMLAAGLTTACFITNCPPGGKRSVGAHLQQPKQCTRCGPENTGRCFGPDICCGPGIGCQVNNWMTRVCQNENRSTRLCRNEGRVCGNGQGVCALDSVCCTTESCSIDRTCESAGDQSLGDRSDSFRLKWSNLMANNDQL